MTDGQQRPAREKRRRVPLMGPYEIQRLLGISRSAFRDVVLHHTFPEALDTTLKRGAVWYEAEVLEWQRRYRGPKTPIAEDPES